MQPWTETDTAREHVESIALTLRETRSVNRIKEQADVDSWETAKSHPNHLVEMGRLNTVRVDGGRRYAPGWIQNRSKSNHASTATLSPDVQPVT